MTINVDLTHKEYVTLLVAVRDQQKEYKLFKNIPCSTKHQKYWEEAYKTNTSLLNKLYAAEQPT